ncbi:Predicted PurR-regulated permease PerM [Peptoniphilus asaccharolyticus DSM 20463]|uniref:Predicted PurR-regulated permease PerM n=1 Tax=Peptoniphilus asaccharolyticus DSM 20463 TaxID=573058 RepID=A0A1W1VKR4_PEPAS|nr:AI-2E family transporter [Peptoniphilus asaccharolyticus]MBL7574456.1 AI-2E family transporter [Peptoniphilus asaccharolyticus]SMB93820.1 Predicted PurR-regulated permease PerM [Peptoniphilus asaccharolyticus DSM 20463]
MKENLELNKHTTESYSTYNKNQTNLALIVFGGILLYFFFLKFTSVQLIFSKVVSILFPFLLGGAIAFVLKIPMNFFEKLILKKTNSKFLKKAARGISLCITLLLVISIVTFMMAMVIPQLVTSLQSLEKQMPLFFKRLIELLKGFPKLEPLAKKVQHFYNSLSLNYLFEQIKHFFLKDDLSFDANAVQTASGIANKIFSGFANGLLAFVFSIYVLLDKDNLGRQTKRMLYSVGGTKIGGFIIHVGNLIDFYFFNFVKGQLLDAVIIGVMTFASMLVLRMPYAPMISVLVGFSDLIPIVGPLIGAAIGFIFILIDSPMQAVFFLVLMIVLQQIQGNIIYPKIVGDKLGIPAMWSLFATIVGGAIGGIVGMWIFIPLVAVIYTLLGEYTNYRLNKLNMNSKLKENTPT